MKIRVIILALVFCTQFAYSQPSTGLVLHLTMDNQNFIDASPILNDIEPIGSFTNTCAVIDDGIVFNGQSSINVLSNTNDFFNTDFTLSFYLRPGNGNAEQVVLSKTKTCLDASAFFILYDPAEHSIQVSLGQNFENRVDIEHKLENNYCWYHVAFVRTGAEHKLYVNGVLVENQKTQSRIFFENDAFLMLGSDDCVPARLSRFTGAIDDFRFYNKPFNSKEILSFYRPTHEILTNDTLIYLGESITARVTDDCTDSYQWNFSSDIIDLNNPNTVITPMIAQRNSYTLTFQDGTCQVTDTLQLIVVDPGDVSCEDIVLPSSFTPNDDGINDEFFISNRNIVEELISFKIYDRWGGVIFETDDKLVSWDGTYKDEKVPAGPYMYRVKHICNEEEKIINGTVIVLR